MAVPAVTYTFTNGRESDATQVNQNFTDLVNALTDGAKTLTIAELVSPVVTITNAAFNSQAAPISDTTTLYVSGGDLYYNDKNGAYIQLTAGGGINAVNQPIPGVVSPASFAFSAGIFTGKAAATTYAKFEMSDLMLYEYTGGITNAVTIKSPSALAASYSLTLPAALPAAKQYLASDNAGATTFNSADTIGSEMTAAGANAVASAVTTTGANAIAGVMNSTGANAVVSAVTSWTPATSVANSIMSATDSTGKQTILSVRAYAEAESASSVAMGTTSDVTSAVVTVTVTGGRVACYLQPKSQVSGIMRGIQCLPQAAGTIGLEARLTRDSVPVKGTYTMAYSNGTADFYVPHTICYFEDAPAAGTYVYRLQCGPAGVRTSSVVMESFKWCVREL